MKYTQFNYRKYEIHSMVLEKVSNNSTVLDIGCAAGYMAQELQSKKCIVYGIDNNPKLLRIAKRYCSKVYKIDLNHPNGLSIHNKKFDYIFMLDVIEHLDFTVKILGKIKKFLKNDSKLIVSTPNIAHISMRLQLLFGNFVYTSCGLMDYSHVHFYTKNTLILLLESYGFKIQSIEPSADFGQLPLVGRLLRHLPKIIQWHITRIFPTMFGVQWLVTCTL